MVKLVNLVAWYGVLWLTFLIMIRLGQNRIWAWVCILLVGTLPGMVYNSFVGMENGIFACGVLWWIYLALSWNWFVPGRTVANWQEVVLSVLLGINFWLRPEGLVFFILVIGFWVWRNRYTAVGFSEKVKIFFALSLPFVVMFLLWVVFCFSQTGRLIPASGISRMWLSWSESWQIGPWLFNPKFTFRLVNYFPLTLFWLLGSVWVFTKWKTSKNFGLMIFLVIIFGVFFVLYSTVLGVHHLARYTVFLMPCMLIIAALAAEEMWNCWSKAGKVSRRWLRGLFFGFLVISLLAVFTIETSRRVKSNTYLSLAQSGPSLRKNYSDAMFLRLGKPAVRPIVLAYSEIQIRYTLDDRYVVSSLDGRTDDLFLRFILGRGVDYISYIKARKINYFMEIVDYNSDPSRWRLSSLCRLREGEVLTCEGLNFTRLPGYAFRVDILGN